jgi:hypothetical protein
VVAILVALVHAATAGRYDTQRNELYFLVCGWHPDFGYVDQPPLVPLISAARQIFGVNIWLLRLPATIVAVGLVFLCAAFARLLDVYSREDGLPPALSGHNQYWLWGPRGYDGLLIFRFGGNAESWRRICGSIEDMGGFGNAYTMPYENDRPIFICRDLRMPLDRLWNRLKRSR